jgi:hypothetical protein
MILRSRSFVGVLTYYPCVNCLGYLHTEENDERVKYLLLFVMRFFPIYSCQEFSLKLAMHLRRLM